MIKEGREEGKKEGRNKGRTEGRKDDLLRPALPRRRRPTLCPLRFQEATMPRLSTVATGRRKGKEGREERQGMKEGKGRGEKER